MLVNLITKIIFNSIDIKVALKSINIAINKKERKTYTIFKSTII